MEILEALKLMDPLNDDQWTADGAPKIDVVKALVDDSEIQVKRQDIIDAAPDFSQENSVIAVDEPKEAVELSADDALDPEVDSELLEQYMDGEILDIKAFIAFLMSVPGSTLEPFRIVVEAQLKAAEQAEKDAQEIKLLLKRSTGFINQRIGQLVPDVSNQQAIQNYIKSQNANRSKKVKMTREILKGVDLKSLDPRAAIDRAMSRKTARGMARPIRT